MLLAGVSPSLAQTVQLAEIQPQTVAPPVAGEQLNPQAEQAEAASTTLTPALLAAYVARQQAQKGFNIFGDAPQPQLTSAMVSAYAETHYRNAALDAINTAAVARPLSAVFTTEDIASIPQPEASSVSDDVLARYARQHFEPTARKVARANQEKLCLTKAIYHEARGESDNGQWAVANVIINRALSKRFPATMCGVIYQNADEGLYHCQFTFACDGQPDMATERQAWTKANRIASAAFSEFQHGERPGVVPGSALFYHTRAVSPDWSNSFKRVAQIGAHVFYSPM